MYCSQQPDNHPVFYNDFELILGLKNLKVVGLMCIGAYVSDKVEIKRSFNKLKKLSSEFNNNVKLDFDLKKKNWFNIGGKTKIYYKADNLFLSVSSRNAFDTEVKYVGATDGSTVSSTKQLLIGKQVYFSTGYDYQLPNPMFSSFLGLPMGCASRFAKSTSNLFGIIDAPLKSELFWHTMLLDSHNFCQENPC